MLTFLIFRTWDQGLPFWLEKARDAALLFPRSVLRASDDLAP